MNINNLKLMLRIAKKYYELGINQQEIALEENISKSTVNRILKKAIKAGYIKFSVNYPIKSVNELEEEFLNSFNLKKVFISPVIVNDHTLILNDICKALARELNFIVNDGDIIGLSWGTTMNCLSNNLIPMEKKNIRLVQLNGGIAKNIKATKSTEIIENFTNAFNGTGYILPVPAIVDNKKIAETIKEDSQIKNVIELGKNANIAIFSIGRLSSESILIHSGYFNKDEYENLRDIGGVGDICSRYFNINGEIIDENLDNRAIGISLNELKDKEYKIGIGVGVEKAYSILGALQGEYINTLYIDENTAQEVLDIYYKTILNKEM